MYATAKIVQRGKSIVTAEGEVIDFKGTVLAKTIGTFKIHHPK
jgi:acyl-coenzyme A thioesterase PaaI-like protein